LIWSAQISANFQIFAELVMPQRYCIEGQDLSAQIVKESIGVVSRVAGSIQKCGLISARLRAPASISLFFLCE